MESRRNGSDLHDSSALLDRYLAISRAISGEMGVQEVLTCVDREIKSLFRHDHMDVTLCLPDQPGYERAFEVGLSTLWTERGDRPNKIENSPIRTLLMGDVPYLLTGDAWEDERFHFEGSFDSPIFDAELHSRLHVPMLVHNEVYGALNISSHRKRQYTLADVAVAQQIADLLAPYFNALLRAEQARKAAMAAGQSRGQEAALRAGALNLTDVMEKERRRIGMDLHDQTLADLTRVARQVERLEKKRAITAADLAEVGDSISSCVAELRRIIEDTRPGVLDLFGFADAVEAQLERSISSAKPAIDARVVDNSGSAVDALPDSRRTALFRIVQEAINNAVKHASPRTILILIDKTETGLRVRVSNDGAEFSLGDSKGDGGLQNMRVRTKLISGRLDITTDRAASTTTIELNVDTDQTGKPDELAHLPAGDWLSGEPADRPAHLS